MAVLASSQRGPGTAVAALPWFVPVISLFNSLVLLSVAVLAIGRSQVLQDTASFWIGIGTSALGILLVFYALAWPGLLPGGGSLIAENPGTPAWFVQIGLSVFSACMLVAVLVRRPGREALVKLRLTIWTAAWILFLVIASMLGVRAEQFLPALVTASGGFTPPLIVWNAVLTVLLMAGAVLSTRCYIKTGDALIGYTAIAQAGFALGVACTLGGMSRYEPSWYLTRAIPTSSSLVVLFGLLFESIQLIRREKKNTARILGAEKILQESRAKLDAAFASMTDAVLISDAEGRLLDFNDAFATFHRFRNKEECSRAFAGSPDTLEIYLENGEPAPAEMCAIPRALRGETASNAVFNLMRRDTGERWTGSYSFGPIRDHDGKIVGSVVVSRDITEQKKIERTLLQSEQHLRNILNSMVAMIGLMTPDGILIEANRNALEVADLEPQDVINKPFESCYWWSWSAGEQKRLRDAIGRAAHGQGSRYDAVIRAAQGQLRTIDFMLSPIFDSDGRVTYLVPSASDITDRKRAEEALALSESFHRQTLESIPGMVFTTRPDGYCDYQSQQWVDYTGVPMSEHLGNGWNALLHPEDRPQAFAAWRSAVEDNAPYDLAYRVRRHDGVYEWFRVIGRQIRDPQGHVIRWFGVAMNIEQLKQAEEQLRDALAAADERRRIFDAMMEHIPMGIVIADAPDATISAVSRYGLEVTGKSREHLEGIAVDQHAETWEIFHADGLTPAANASLPLTRAVQKGELVRQEEWIIRRPDGRRIPILCTAAPIRNSEGDIIGGVIGYQDIGERKRMEEALRVSEKRFRELADSMPQLVWTANSDGQVDYYNVRYKEYQGLEPRADGTLRWNPILHEEDEGPTREAWKKAYRAGETFQVEHRVQLADGSYRWHLSRGIPARDNNGRIVKWFGTATDIENLKAAEAQLRQLNETLEQKVAERTQVAEARSRELQKLAVELIETEERERRRIASLLHEDLQQILAAARMILQAVRKELPEVPELLDVEQLLEASITKSRRLSHELSPAVLHHSGLVPALEWLGRQMHEQFGLNVVLDADARLALENTPLKVFLFRAAQELLYNVVKHAGVKRAHVTLSNRNGGIVLTVSDRGGGIDPSFLNLPSAKGGLGLLSIQERADSIAGSFKIESTPGKGSRFTLTVPLILGSSRYKAEDSTEAVYSLNSPAGPPLREKENIRVLFADDHKVMRDGLIRLVQGQPDIEVVGEAADGREALELADHLRPDVIIMDISMPGMDGIEATRQIKAQLPRIRIIGLSMHEDEHIARTLLQAGAESLVNKTASSAKLLKAIYGLHHE